jgi:murein tripeptide amidase MpaA
VSGDNLSNFLTPRIKVQTNLTRKIGDNFMTPYPTYEDMMSESKALAEANGQLVKFEEIGKSEKGRPIGLLIIADSTIEKKNKIVFLLMGGTDGSEEVGRAAVIGFAKEILKPQYREHLKKQIILIVPVTNPDGRVETLPDIQGNGRYLCKSNSFARSTSKNSRRYYVARISQHVVTRCMC